MLVNRWRARFGDGSYDREGSLPTGTMMAALNGYPTLGVACSHATRSRFRESNRSLPASVPPGHARTRHGTIWTFMLVVLGSPARLPGRAATAENRCGRPLSARPGAVTFVPAAVSLDSRPWRSTANPDCTAIAAIGPTGGVYLLNLERCGWPRMGRAAGRGAVTRAFRRAPSGAACPAFLAGFADRTRTRVPLPIQLLQATRSFRPPSKQAERGFHVGSDRDHFF
jgi:hypothetical protein